MRKKPTYRMFRYWKKPHCKEGENNPCAKVGKSVVDYIRQQYQPRVFTAAMLARKFDLSKGHVKEILRGTRWRRGFLKVNWRKLNADQEGEIIKRFHETKHFPQRHPQRWSQRRLAKFFNVSPGLIVYVLKGKNRRDARVVDRACLENK